jgi:hypothetical protein
LSGELRCPFRARTYDSTVPRPMAWATMMKPLQG